MEIAHPHHVGLRRRRLAVAVESAGGIGPGLAISERATRLHGGNVAARNHPEGGLPAEIRLPAAP